MIEAGVFGVLEGAEKTILEKVFTPHPNWFNAFFELGEGVPADKMVEFSAINS